MRLIRKIVRSKIWYWVYAALMILAVCSLAYCIVYRTMAIPVDAFRMIVIASVVVTLLLFAEDQRRRPLEPPPEMSRERQAAMYPAPPVRWVREDLRPNCFMLGTWSGQYVGVDLMADTTSTPHWAILASSGGGKTSAFIGPLLLKLQNLGALILDPKGGELYHKFARWGDPDVVVVNPSDRTAYGYDPFYRIHSQTNPSQQEVIRMVTDITQTLVPLKPDAKDPIWPGLAQTYLNAVFVFGIIKKKKTNIIDLIDWMKSMSARELVKLIVKETGPSDYSHQLLLDYKDMPNDTFGSMLVDVNDGIAVFSDPDVRYALRENPRKCSPLDIESKKIFISIPVNDVVTDRQLLRIMVNQTVHQLLERELWHIEQYRTALLVLDELPVLLEGGPLPSLLLGIKELRGYKVRVITAQQSLESLSRAYTKEECIDLLSNMGLVILDGGFSMNTINMISELSSKYYEKELSKSINKDGGGTTLRYQEKPVLQPGELNNLGDECVIMTNREGYLRLKKNPYYEDPELLKLAQEIEEHNLSIVQVRHIAQESVLPDGSVSIKKMDEDNENNIEEGEVS